MQPVLDIQSRRQEESRIVWNWLKRLETVLAPIDNHVFLASLKSVGLATMPAEGSNTLRHDLFDKVMQMSTSKLRKRLYRSGTTYKNIVLEVRMRLASNYLTSTQLSIQDIAYLLDYTQPGPFSRAFKKYYGVTPSSVRQQRYPV